MSVPHNRVPGRPNGLGTSGARVAFAMTSPAVASSSFEAMSTTLPPRYGLPEQAPHLAHYLSTLRCWISGNDAWSRETQRYARA
ncbi:hypothetical protein [Streptomyces sp. NPDC008141]|uniref:hypothetical protein n=1 Tax=Streptomyces sp. NPDC008141 TaxID=3364815 RepID=UPI0036F10E1D